MAETLQDAQKLEAYMCGLQYAADDLFTFFGAEDVGDDENCLPLEKRKTSHGLFTTLEEWRLPENIDDITHFS